MRLLALLSLLLLTGCVACGGPFGNHRSDADMIHAFCSGIG